MPSVTIRRRVGSEPVRNAANRSLERKALGLVSLVVALGLALTYLGKNDGFDEVGAGLETGRIVNLNALRNPDPLVALFRTRFTDDRDRSLLASELYSRINSGGSLPNVGNVNTSRFYLQAATVEARGGEALLERLRASYAALGLSPDVLAREKAGTGPAYPSAQAPAAEGLTVRGVVVQTEEDGLVTQTDRPVAQVLVTLEARRDGQVLRRDTLRTGDDGAFAFTGLPAGADVAVLPLRPYLEFRRHRIEDLGGDRDLRLEARTHTIRPLDARVFSRLKPALVVRAPEDFRNTVLLLAGLFFAVFWGIHAVWSWRSFRGDALLLPAVMLLCGLGLMLMLSLPDPLRDRFLARTTLQGIIIGGVGLLAVSLIDVQRWGHRLSLGGKSFFWLLLAALMSAALLVWGTGPEGTSAKVNLWIFQPVEAIKLCLLIFFAGYFARHWALMRGTVIRGPLLRWLPSWLRLPDIPQLRYLVPVVLGVGLALGFFFAQGDLGPALVFVTTFLLLYGVARKRWPAVALGFVGLAAGFTFFYQIGQPAKLANRLQMMLHPWNNTVYGGSHLAESFWTYAGGGITGQGLGEGSAIQMPAAHTDMVLPAIGEELGFVGVVLVLGLYVLLLMIGLRIARRRSPDFGFFLALGLVASTALQIVLITGGTLGVIPLAGVVSPYLSYGRSALILHLVFAGLLAALSNDPAPPDQQRETERHFRAPLHWIGLGALVVFGLLALRAGWIQVWRGGDWLIKPTIVVRADGKRAYVDNPRIGLIRNAVPRGTIYDRNGIPLATSRDEEIDAFADTLRALGVDPEALRAQPVDRFYPFGATALYLLGDLNRQFVDSPFSLFAEYNHLSHLRGYDNVPETIYDRVPIDGGVRVDTLTRYDYSTLRPMLEAGTDSRAFRRFREQDRSLTLTIDVRLQQAVTRFLDRHVAQRPQLRGKTISAVALEAATGEVLASVTYPLPEQVYTDLAAAKQNPDLFDRGYGTAASTPPGSTLKLATAMAAYRTAGDAADDWTVQVTGAKTPAGSVQRWFRPGSVTGEVTMERAIVWSSNVYFAELALQRIPVDDFAEVLHQFGFRVGLDPSDNTRAGIARRLQELRNREQAGFGQGSTIGSPLQVAALSAAVANNGRLPAIRWIRDPDNPPPPPEPVIEPRHARQLGCYMRKVVTEGTGRAARVFDASNAVQGDPCAADRFFLIAGKTGTAQQVIDGSTTNHAWFTGYAPYRVRFREDEPRIAVAVVVEQMRGGGGSVAGPIAGAIFREAAALGLIREED